MFTSGATLRLAVAGTVVAAIVSLFVAQEIRRMLYAVTTAERVTFAGMVGLLATVAAFGAWLPARRASRLDSLAALKAE